MHSNVAGAFQLIVNIFLALLAAFNNLIYVLAVIKSSGYIYLHFYNAYFLIISTNTLSISILPNYKSVVKLNVFMPYLFIFTTANQELTSPILKKATFTPGFSGASFQNSATLLI